MNLAEALPGQSGPVTLPTAKDAYANAFLDAYDKAFDEAIAQGLGPEAADDAARAAASEAGEAAFDAFSPNSDQNLFATTLDEAAATKLAIGEISSFQDAQIDALGSEIDNSTALSQAILEAAIEITFADGLASTIINDNSATLVPGISVVNSGIAIDPQSQNIASFIQGIQRDDPVAYADAPMMATPPGETGGAAPGDPTTSTEGDNSPSAPPPAAPTGNAITAGDAQTAQDAASKTALDQVAGGAAPAAAKDLADEVAAGVAVDVASGEIGGQAVAPIVAADVPPPPPPAPDLSGDTPPPPPPDGIGPEGEPVGESDPTGDATGESTGDGTGSGDATGDGGFGSGGFNVGGQDGGGSGY